MKFVTPRELEKPQNMALMMKDPVTYEEAMSIFIEEDMCRGVRRVCKTEPAGHKGCKWVFKTKLDENGQIEHYKARLVAQGFSQIPRVDLCTGHTSLDTLNVSRISQLLPLGYSSDGYQICFLRNLENNFHKRDSQRSWTSDHGVFTKIINEKLFVIVIDVDNFLLFLPNIEVGISVIVNC